jgi:hypothetical protein
MSYTSITVQLPECCRLRLREIHRIIDAWATVHGAIQLSIWHAISDPPTAFVTLALTDWTLWHQALASCNQTSRSRCIAVCTLHEQFHIMRQNRDLVPFWSQMRQSFEQ